MNAHRITPKIKSISASNKLPWIIIVVGIALRLVRYIYNSSLWFDEAGIAIDIINRPISDLIYPSPDYNQGYPLAFMILVKLSTQFFGTSEYAIRSTPLTAGILALFLFYKVAKSYLEPRAVLIALGLFAISDSLVFQSSDLKPYSSDVLVTLLIFIVTIYVQSKKFSMPRIILFGIFGAVAIWFSNPAVFVLAGVGATMGTFSLMDKDWKDIGRLSICYLIWIVSFIANYFLYIHKMKVNFDVSMDWILARQDAYMPIPPTSIADIKWFTELFFDVFNNPLAMSLTGIAALAFLAGCITMYTPKKRILVILISPLIVTFIAAALHQYAFKGRFIFFLLPLLLLFIAEGAESIRSRTYQNAKLIGIIFIALLFFHPLSLSAYRVIKPFYWEDLKPILKYVKNNWQEGDVLYVHYYAQNSFNYYSQYYPEPYRFDDGEYIIGIAPRTWYRIYRKREFSKYYNPGAPIEQSSIEIFNLYARDLDQLKGKKRVWILFTSSIPKDGINEEKFFIYHLETMGKQLDFFGRSGISAVYLYDLSSETAIFNDERVAS